MRHDPGLRWPFLRARIRGPLATIAVASLGVLFIASCSRGGNAAPDEAASRESAAATSVAPVTTTPAGPNPSLEDLVAADRLSQDFGSFVSPVDSTVGIVAAPVGRNGPVVLLGEWQEGAAWSTSKVPLVLAALDNDPEHRVTPAIRLAITQSDNTAADEVWQSLGAPDEAAAKMDKVLRDFGDPTKVESRRLRGPRYSAFGQTIWSLANQAKFLAALACSQKAVSVLDLMQQVEPGQRWGLGTLPGAKFKGGWGPSDDESRYLLRQFGLIPSANGLFAVAIAADVNSRSYEGAISAADALSDWISAHLVDFPAGTCPSGTGG